MSGRSVPVRRSGSSQDASWRSCWRRLLTEQSSGELVKRLERLEEVSRGRKPCVVVVGGSLLPVGCGQTCQAASFDSDLGRRLRMFSRPACRDGVCDSNPPDLMSCHAKHLGCRACIGPTTLSCYQVIAPARVYAHKAGAVSGGNNVASSAESYSSSRALKLSAHV